MSRKEGDDVRDVYPKIKVLFFGEGLTDAGRFAIVFSLLEEWPNTAVTYLKEEDFTGMVLMIRDIVRDPL